MLKYFKNVSKLSSNVPEKQTAWWWKWDTVVKTIVPYSPKNASDTARKILLISEFQFLISSTDPKQNGSLSKGFYVLQNLLAHSLKNKIMLS